MNLDPIRTRTDLATFDVRLARSTAPAFQSMSTVTPPRARYRATIERAVADIKGGAALSAAEDAAAS